MFVSVRCTSCHYIDGAQIVAILVSPHCNASSLPPPTWADFTFSAIGYKCITETSANTVDSVSMYENFYINGQVCKRGFDRSYCPMFKVIKAVIWTDGLQLSFILIVYKLFIKTHQTLKVGQVKTSECFKLYMGIVLQCIQQSDMTHWYRFGEFKFIK